MSTNPLTFSGNNTDAEFPTFRIGVTAEVHDAPASSSLLSSLQRDAAASVALADASPTRIRTAAQRLVDAEGLPPLIPLFGPLWETPGIAILAGDTGVGKSVLAVHIAHLISSEQADLLGLPCAMAEKVLYYDFELTDRQFSKRFEGLPFSDRLIIGDTNPVTEDADGFSFEQIAADLDKTGARVVILDNITALALKTTADADISMGIMRGLKKLQIERGISCLVLAHTPKILPGTPLTLNHLAGSKHLSNFADSVFFISKSVQGPHTRYIKQVKNRTDEEMPGVLVCEMGTSDGYLGLTLVGPGEEADHLAALPNERATPASKAGIKELLEELPALLGQPLPASTLEGQLADLLDITTRTIRTHLRALTEPGGGYVMNEAGEVCSIIKEQFGREVRYSLPPVMVPADSEPAA